MTSIPIGADRSRSPRDRAPCLALCPVPAKPQFSAFMTHTEDQAVVGRAFSDGSGVAITGPDQAERLHKHRLGGGSVPEPDPRLPKEFTVSAILTCEEAILALEKGWLRLSPPSTIIRRHSFHRVFEDLWKRGMWVTSGMKFGADMLVYQQAPGIVHSSYIILVRESDQALDVLDLISVGRLATAVNKRVVVANVEQSSGEVGYSTMEWHM